MKLKYGQRSIKYGKRLGWWAASTIPNTHTSCVVALPRWFCRQWNEMITRRKSSETENSIPWTCAETTTRLLGQCHLLLQELSVSGAALLCKPLGATGKYQWLQARKSQLHPCSQLQDTALPTSTSQSSTFGEKDVMWKRSFPP